MLLEHLIKQCGNDLSRENIIKQAKNLKEVILPTVLPGIRINTSDKINMNYTQMRLQRWTGNALGPVQRGPRCRLGVMAAEFAGRRERFVSMPAGRGRQCIPLDPRGAVKSRSLGAVTRPRLPVFDFSFLSRGAFTGAGRAPGPGWT